VWFVRGRIGCGGLEGREVAVCGVAS
jgi:hypothetical protein